MASLNTDDKKTNCWEFMNCGVDRPCSDRPCPAYPYMGRMCWAIAGTVSGVEVQGQHAKKMEDCTRCQFYRDATMTKNA